MIAQDYRYIVATPGIRSGNPVVEGTRIGVHDVVGLVLNGATVDVASGATAGEVKLRGIVSTVALQKRAVEIAEGTVGVEKVINEIAVPE